MDLTEIPLSLEEKTLKAECEQSVEALKDIPAMFYVAGQALSIYNGRRLYREEFPTFEDACRGKWNMSDKNAYRLMAAAETRQNLLPAFLEEVIPASEWVIRPLTILPSSEAQQATLRLAIDTAPGGKVTQAHLQSVATVMQELLDTQDVEVDPVTGVVTKFTYAVDSGDGEQITLAQVLDGPISEETRERLLRHKQYLIDAIKLKELAEKRVSLLIRKPCGIENAPLGFQVKAQVDQAFLDTLQSCQAKEGCFSVTLTWTPAPKKIEVMK